MSQKLRLGQNRQNYVTSYALNILYYINIIVSILYYYSPP